MSSTMCATAASARWVARDGATATRGRDPTRRAIKKAQQVDWSAIGGRRANRAPRRGARVIVAAEEEVGTRVETMQGSAEEIAAGVEAMKTALAAADAPECDEATMVWFLRDRKLDADAASAKLINFLRWRKELGAITDEDVRSSLEQGAAYVHPHLDKEGRACIVVEVAKHVIKDRDLEISKKHAVRAVEQCIEMMEAAPNGSESIYAVWDMQGFSGANADLDLAKFCILDVFREYYPKRLSQVAAIDSPWTFKPVWTILKPLIGKYSSVVQFVTAKEVIENFNPGEAPKCLAGDRV